MKFCEAYILVRITAKLQLEKKSLQQLDLPCSLRSNEEQTSQRVLNLNYFICDRRLLMWEVYKSYNKDLNHINTLFLLDYIPVWISMEFLVEFHILLPLVIGKTNVSTNYFLWGPRFLQKQRMAVAVSFVFLFFLFFFVCKLITPTIDWSKINNRWSSHTLHRLIRTRNYYFTLLSLIKCYKT